MYFTLTFCLWILVFILIKIASAASSLSNVEEIETEDRGILTCFACKRFIALVRSKITEKMSKVNNMEIMRRIDAFKNNILFQLISCVFAGTN